MALTGIKVIEFAGLAPGPFAGLVLADNGASVTRIDQPRSRATLPDVLCRGKRSIVVDWKRPSGRKLLEEMISSADVVIDPFRPGVLERQGLGPELFLGCGTKKGLNPKLIYARIVGFPRTGAHKDMAGHDLNYLALSGVLSMLPGTPEKPSFPINILADFAGGGLMCAVGILLALIDRGRTGQGQVVNTDMVSGARFLASFPLIHSFLQTPTMDGPRGTNMLDSGAPFYNVYTCQDGRWISLGCLEPQFFKVFIEGFETGLPDDFNPLDGWRPDPLSQFDHEQWPKMAEYFSKGFATKPRDFWAKHFHGTDACCLPVLTPEEVIHDIPYAPTFHPEVRGVRNKENVQYYLEPGTHTNEILKELGVNQERIRELHNSKAVVSAESQRKSKM